MSLPVFLSSAAGAFTVMTIWYLAQWACRRRQRRIPARPGQARCYGCCIMGGLDLTMDAEEAVPHLQAHTTILPHKPVDISTVWVTQPPITISEAIFP